MGTTQPFSQDGVYQHHPEFNTLYKAAWMGIFGSGHFGWKMAGIGSMVVAIAAIYCLGGMLDGKVTAIVAGSALASSHYLYGLMNGGANHLDALPVTILAFLLFLLGVDRKSLGILFLAGVAIGVGFYFHYSARIIGPVMLITALVSVSPRDYLRLWPIIIGFCITVWPTFLLAQEEILRRMFDQTAAGYSEVVAGPVAERLISNLSLNLPAFFFNETAHTYVSGPLLDPVTGTLGAIGIGIAVGSPGRLTTKLCLAWLTIAFLATGLTSPYPTTAVTRIFPMLPPLALLAGMTASHAYALARAKQSILERQALKVAVTSLLAVVLAAVFCLNAHRAIYSTHEVFHYTPGALAVGALRSEHCDGQLARTVFVGDARDSTLSKAVRSYDPDAASVAVIPFTEFDLKDPLPNPSCVVFHKPDTQESRRAMAQLQQRYPSGVFYTFTTPSRKSSVEYFYLPQS